MLLASLWATIFYLLCSFVNLRQKHLQEIRFLKTTLQELGCTRFETRAELLKLKQFLSARISFDHDKKDAKRPLLRASAAETLRSGYGFCGENSRVAMVLMALGGISSRRFYLVGKRWHHVLVEIYWKNEWYLFDGHSDPTIMMSDDLVARIPSPRFELLYNECADVNPWVDYFRIKPLHLLGFGRLAKYRVPRVLSVTLESPSLIKAYGCLVAAAGVATLAEWV